MDTVNVIVEIPRDSKNKYEYDHENHTIKLDHHLIVSMGYPAEYGFIPDTLGGDENGEDAKLICVPAYDPNWKSATDISDVPKQVLDRIAHFFTVYKDLDEGKWMKVENYVGRAEALAELEASIARFKG